MDRRVAVATVFNDSDAPYVGSHPKPSVGHLANVVDIVVVTVGSIVNLRKCARCWVKESQSRISSHPDVSVAGLIDAAHVVARQT